MIPILFMLYHGVGKHYLRLYLQQQHNWMHRPLKCVSSCCCLTVPGLIQTVQKHWAQPSPSPRPLDDTSHQGHLTWPGMKLSRLESFSCSLPCSVMLQWGQWFWGNSCIHVETYFPAVPVNRAGTNQTHILPDSHTQNTNSRDTESRLWNNSMGPRGENPIQLLLPPALCQVLNDSAWICFTINIYSGV